MLPTIVTSHRRIVLGTLVAFLALALPADTAAQQADRRPGVAVLPFTNGGSFGPDREDLQALEVGLQQMLLTELAQNDALRIVERSTLRELLEEQDLGRSGRVDASTAAGIGELVGARYIVTGVFVDLDGDFRMDARVVDVETGEIVTTERVRDERQNLYDVLVTMAERIVAGTELPPLPAPAREARRSRDIPAEAVTLYSRAQVFEDAGYRDRAVEVYQRIVDRFPDMTEARAALTQLTDA